MALIEWTKKLETGISIIDFQHRKLVAMINEIAEIAKENDPKIKELVIGVSITQLVEYTVYHFQTEEDLFKEINYVESEQHIKAHNELKVNVVKLQARFANGEDVSADLLKFLKAWLENHIVVTDMKYVDIMRKQKPDLFDPNII